MSWLDPAIRVDASRCVVVRAARATCRRCEEACPTEAIRLEGGTPRLEMERCLHCGLCLTACPTGVFRLEGLAWPDLIARLARHAEEGTLTLRCAYARTEAEATFPCLGVLDADALLALAAYGLHRLTLRTADCETCPVKGGERLRAALDEAARRGSGALEVAWERVEAEAEVDLEAALRGLDNPWARKVDRRGFLRLLGAGLGTAAARPLSPFLPEEGETGERRRAQLPPTRLALLHAVTSVEEAPAFPTYRIGESCDDCQDADALCVRFCPAEALQREREAGTIRFTLRPERCLDCGLCVDLCPRQAIRRGEPAPGGEPLPLRTFEIMRCRRCGRETIAAEDGLCPACRRESDLHAMLRGWLTDSR